MAGLAAIVASNGCGSRASSAGDAGLRSLLALQALLLLQPRSHDGTGSEEHGQRKSRPPLQSTIWQRSWKGSKKTSTSRIRRSLLPCKQKWSRLGKLTSSPNAKRALQRLQSNLRSRPSKIARPRWQSRRTRSPSWKRQPRRQLRRPSRRLRNCKGKSTSCRKSTMRSWLALSSPRIWSQFYRATCVRRSRSPASHRSVGNAFTGLSSLLAAAGPREGHFARGVGRCQGFRAVAAGSARGRARGQESKYGGVRRASEASLAISNATSTQSTVREALMRPQARDRASNPAPRFWSEKDSQVASPIRKHLGQLPLPT